MNARKWTVAGCVIGVVALLMLTGLGVLAYATDLKSSPRVSVFVVANLLLGFVAISLVVGAYVVRTLVDTMVNRIAAVLATADDQPKVTRIGRIG